MNKQVNHEELCDQALEYYDDLSSKAMHSNGTVVEAIKFYKQHGMTKNTKGKYILAPGFKLLPERRPAKSEHEKNLENTKGKVGKKFLQCGKCFKMVTGTIDGLCLKCRKNQPTKKPGEWDDYVKNIAATATVDSVEVTCQKIKWLADQARAKGIKEGYQLALKDHKLTWKLKESQIKSEEIKQGREETPDGFKVVYISDWFFKTLEKWLGSVTRVSGHPSPYPTIALRDGPAKVEFRLLKHLT